VLGLAVGERPLELAHHHRIERPISRSRPLQERRRVRTPLPSHPPRTAHIEELRSDRPAPAISAAAISRVCVASSFGYPPREPRRRNRKMGWLETLGFRQ